MNSLIVLQRIKNLIFFALLSNVVKTELTMERIDGIADLAGLAKKYFSDEPNMKYVEPNIKALNSFAWGISDLWDENKSGLYVLSRMATMIDQKDGKEGEMTLFARIIRSYADRSLVRKVHMSTQDESSTFTPKFSHDANNVNANQLGEIEKLYFKLNDVKAEKEADDRLEKRIQSQWTDSGRVIEDLKGSAVYGYFNVFNKMIKMGGSVPFITAEAKIDLNSFLLSLPNLKLKPSTVKWLIAMEIYKEDQMIVIEKIEKAHKESNLLGKSGNNTLFEMLEDVKEITERTSGTPGTKNESLNDTSLEGALKKMKNRRDRSRRDNEKDKGKDNSSVKKNYEYFQSNSDFYSSDNSLKPILKNNINTKSVRISEPHKSEISTKKSQKKSSSRLSVTKNTKSLKVNSNPEAVESKPTEAATNAEDLVEQENENKIISQSEDRYITKEEKEDQEVEKIIFEEPNPNQYDNDGVWDDQEKEQDRRATLVVAIVIGMIVMVSVGLYLFLKMRMVRRNRTVMIASTALIQS